LASVVFDTLLGLEGGTFAQGVLRGADVSDITSRRLSNRRSLIAGSRNGIGYVPAQIRIFGL
jgi:hypothetical protein